MASGKFRPSCRFVLVSVLAAIALIVHRSKSVASTLFAFSLGTRHGVHEVGTRLLPRFLGRCDKAGTSLGTRHGVHDVVPRLLAGFLGGCTKAAGSPWLLGWLGISEIACPNCSKYLERAILYYPTRGVVVVIDGGHGFDS